MMKLVVRNPTAKCAHCNATGPLLQERCWSCGHGQVTRSPTLRDRRAGQLEPRRFA